MSGCSLRADVREAGDMSEDLSASADLGGQDMTADMGGCEESDEALCARLELECGLLASVVDACGITRSVQCGACEDVAGGVCQANSCVVCGPSACEAGTCGTITDACGASVVCGCPEDGICNTTSGLCECPTPSCEGVACGTVRNGCGASAECADTCAPQGLACVAEVKACAVPYHMSDPSLPDQEFGWSLATGSSTSASQLLIGAPGARGSRGAGVGEVQLWARDEGLGWSIRSRLQPPLDASSRFGEGVALYDDLALVGAPGAPNLNGGRSGVAVLHRVSGTTWTKLREFSPPEAQASERAGERVALDVTDGYTHAAVSASGQGVSGRVHVYTTLRPDDLNWSVIELPQSAPSGTGHQVGAAVAMRAGVLVISVLSLNPLRGGEVQIYRYIASVGWTLTATLYGDDAPDASRLAYGKSVAIDEEGDLVAVGDPGARSAEGRVYLYARDDSGMWSYKRTLSSPDRHQGQRFGASLAIARGVPVQFTKPTVFVGAPTTDSAQLDRVYSFTLDAQHAVTTTQTLSSRTPAGSMGMSVAANTEALIAGAPQDQSRAGAIYIAPRNTLPTTTP